MLKTNYDTSKTGIDVELSIFFDNDASNDRFDDDLVRFKDTSNSYNATSRFYYIGDGSEAPDYVSECLDLSAVTSKQARQYVLDQTVGEYLTIKEAIRDCKDDFDGDWMDALITLLDETNIGEAMRDGMPDIGIDKYLVVSASGHSQGDYSEIMCKLDAFKDDCSASEYFSNIIYNSPIYARLLIDGEDYYLDEELNDCYTYDKDELTNIINSLDITDEAKSIAIEMLPEYPDYA